MEENSKSLSLPPAPVFTYDELEIYSINLEFGHSRTEIFYASYGNAEEIQEKILNGERFLIHFGQTETLIINGELVQSAYIIRLDPNTHEAYKDEGVRYEIEYYGYSK